MDLFFWNCTASCSNLFPYNTGIYSLLVDFVVAWFNSFRVFSYSFELFFKSFASEEKHSKNEIALTFDDGPHPNTSQILDLLHKFEMKATFFCIGKQVEMYPEIAQRMVKEGHIIANHTYTHTPKMGFLPTKKVWNEIQKCSDIIEKATGKKVMLYRPPFGVTNPNIAKAVEKSGLKVIGWKVRSLDTVISSEKKLAKRLISRISKGSIILLHDNRNVTVQTLEQLLITIQKKQLTSVTVSELLNIKPYQE